MKMILASPRFASGAMLLVFALAAVGCAEVKSTADAPKKKIPPASIGVASSGIGGPGGDSEDTRAVGTIATGEGNDEDVRSGVQPVTAVPGAGHATAGH